AAQTALPGINVTDEMTLARGAPDGYAALAAFGLSQLGNLQTGEVALSNADYTVSGVAADAEAYEAELARATNGLPDAGTLVAANITPPAIDGPYVWSASKAADGAITLEGFAPSLDARNAIEAQAASANEGATITNNLKIATGAPEGFEQLTAFGLGQLSGLSTGTSSLSDLAYSINGTAIDSASFDAVFEAANGTLPSDALLASATIIPPARDGSYTWVASKSSDNQITLNGFAPSVEARAAIEAEAIRTNPGATVVNGLQVAAGAPEGFSALTTFGLTQLNGLESGSVSTSDLDYSISGVAADSASFDAVATAANGDLPAGASLANASIIAPTLEGNYTWSASKSADNQIVLEGFAPSAQVRADIATQAANANEGATIVNNLQVASGAPDGFQDLTAFGLGQLPSLATGKVSTNNLDYAIEGTAIDSAAFDAASTAANGTLPAGAALASADIAPPAADGAYVWNAQKAPDGTVTLTGLMPTVQARDRIAARAAEVNPGATINNQMQIAAGAPEGFVDAADYSLGYLPNFSAGSASLSGLDMSIEGQALDLNAFDVAGGLGASAPAGYALQANVSLPPVSGTYELVATKTDDVLVLNGVAPSAEAKAAIIQAAEALDGVNIVDRISLASGAPDGIDWGQSGAFAVTGLNGIRNGTATLRADALSIDGEATDGDSFAAANTAWDGDLPAGTSLASKVIRLPQISPYEWTAERGDAVTISGYVPSRDVGDAIAATAADLFGSDASVTDNQQLGGGAPVGFEAASSVGLNAINRLQDARAEIRANALRVTGMAATEAAKEAI
ncbi:MAG: BON domain-containing protein, partial [Ahrensia sp.]